MSWSPDAGAFVLDLEAKPSALRDLADALVEDPWRTVRHAAERIVLLGMGSSRFAALPVAARLRARGIDAVAEYASSSVAHPGGPGTLAVGISASGSTDETVAALRRHRRAGSTTVAVTNTDGAALEGVAELHIAVLAGAETGGVACRSFQHTVGVLLALVDPVSAGDTVRAAADGTEDLLARRDGWLEDATELCTATRATYLIAPDARLSSAEQGALMLREGPRLQADACEAGDWLHVDVYLTRPLDYRAILFAGSAYDHSVMDWMRERDGGVLAVGRDVTGAEQTLRYAGDERDDVALLTEVLVPELIAATAWLRRA